MVYNAILLTDVYSVTDWRVDVEIRDAGYLFHSAHNGTLSKESRFF